MPVKMLIIVNDPLCYNVYVKYVQTIYMMKPMMDAKMSMLKVLL